MNTFQTVRDAYGVKDEKGFQQKIPLMAKVEGIKPAEFDQKSGTKYQQITITNEGETNKVKIWCGKNPDMNNSVIGQAFPFDVAPNYFKNNWYYSGFWNFKESQMKPLPPPQPQQAPPQAPQSQKAPDWDKIALGKVRTHLMGSVLAANAIPEYDRLEEYVNWCMTGEQPGQTFIRATNMAMGEQKLLPVDGSMPETEDDIPF